MCKTLMSCLYQKMNQGSSKPLLTHCTAFRGIRCVNMLNRHVLSKHNILKLSFHLVGWIDDNPWAISQAELDTCDCKYRRLKYWASSVMCVLQLRKALSSVFALVPWRHADVPVLEEAMAMGRCSLLPPMHQVVVKRYRTVLNGYLVGVKFVDMTWCNACNTLLKTWASLNIWGSVRGKLRWINIDVHQVNKHMIGWSQDIY